MRIFKTKSFSKWAKKEDVTDQSLKDAVQEIAFGLLDADLGGGLVKKRVARSGQGKRGGYRTLIAFKETSRAVYVFGFSKNDHSNITKEEEKIYKQLAKSYLMLSNEMLNTLLGSKTLLEVK